MRHHYKHLEEKDCFF